jgi:hypothetical protein
MSELIDFLETLNGRELTTLYEGLITTVREPGKGPKVTHEIVKSTSSAVLYAFTAHGLEGFPVPWIGVTVKHSFRDWRFSFQLSSIEYALCRDDIEAYGEDMLVSEFYNDPYGIIPNDVKTIVRNKFDPSIAQAAANTFQRNVLTFAYAGALRVDTIFNPRS